MFDFLTMSMSLKGPFEGQIALIIENSIYLSTKIELKYDHCDLKRDEINFIVVLSSIEKELIKK